MPTTPAKRPPVWVWWFIVPASLIAGAAFALTVWFPPELVERIVRQQVRASMRREVRFAGAALSLWPPVRLSVTRPELAEPGGFTQGTAFGAERLDLDLDLLPLLSRRFTVRRLEVREPAVHLVMRADGTTNLDSLTAPQRPGAAKPSLDFDVREFQVHSGRVLVDDMAAARRIAFGIETKMGLSSEQRGQRLSTSGQTEITEVRFGPSHAARASDLDAGLEALVWRIDHKGRFDTRQQRLALEKLALRLGGTELSLAGLVDQVGPRARFDLRARGDRVDLAQVLRWVSVADAKALKGLSGRGQLSFDLAIKGAATQPGRRAVLPTITGTLALRDGAFRYPGASAEVSRLAFHSKFTPDRVEIPDLACTVSGQPVRAQLTATRFADPLVRFAVQGDIDLGAIAPLLADPGTQLAGRAAVNVRGSGRAADPGTLALEGTAVLRDVSVVAKNLPKKIEGIHGTVRFSPQRADVQGLTAKAGKSSYVLDAHVTRPLALMAAPGKVAPAGVTFDFRSPYLDLAELLPTTPGAPFLPNAEGSGKVRIGQLKQGKLDVRSVSADITLAPAQLDAPAFAMQGYGGVVKGSARFDLRDTRHPVYTLKSDIENVQADALLSTWTPAKGLLQGVLNSNLELSGRGDQPDEIKRTLTLVGLAALSNGTFGPGPTLDAISRFVKVPAFRQVKFQDLKIPLRVVQGRVISDAVHLTGAYGDWALAGSVGFDGGLDYAVSITLPPAVAAELGARNALAAGALSDDQGRVLLDLRVTGTAKHPRVAWDPRAMRDRLAGRASTALAEQREKLEADARAAAARILADKLGIGKKDSTRSGPDLKDMGAAVRDSIRKAAGGLLDDFFKKPKLPAPVVVPPVISPPVVVPVTPPADSAARDTTAR